MNWVAKVNEAYRRDEISVRHQERALALYTRLGGAEIRPTRAFVWLGGDREGQRILALGLTPRLSARARKRRHVDFRNWRVSYLGNPVATLALFTYNFARRPSSGVSRSES